MATAAEIADQTAYLAALRAARLQYATRGHVENYAVDGRSMGFRSLEELDGAINRARRELARMEAGGIPVQYAVPGEG